MCLRNLYEVFQKIKTGYVISIKICCQLFPKAEKDFDEIPVELVPSQKIFLIINLHNLVSGGAGKAHIKGIYFTAEKI